MNIFTLLCESHIIFLIDGGIGINKLNALLVAFLILALISGIGMAAEIIVKPGNSIQTRRE